MKYAIRIMSTISRRKISMFNLSKKNGCIVRNDRKQQYKLQAGGYSGADGPILKNSVSIFFTVFIDLWYNQFERLNKGDCRADASSGLPLLDMKKITRESLKKDEKPSTR